MSNYIVLLQKLQTTETCDTWTLDEKRDILKLYRLISKKEALLCDLVYQHHGCDSWEHIFRDYDNYVFNEKAAGIKIAIDDIQKQRRKKKFRTCKECGKSIYSPKPWHPRCAPCNRVHKAKRALISVSING